MQKLILVILLIFWANNVLAQTVYKSVDKEGNVTYSNTPPEDAKKVEDTGIVSSPTPSGSGDASGDDVERIQKAADEMERDRKAREQQREKEQKEIAKQEQKEKAPTETDIPQRHRPIVQHPIHRPPPVGGVPTPPNNTKPIPKQPIAPGGPPVARPLPSGGGN